MSKYSKKVFSVYVGNVPVKINWKWLWKVFDKRVKVIDVFLSKVRIPNNSRFGFVRFQSMEEASRAVKLFDGVLFLDKVLRVALARDYGRSQYWRKVVRPAAKSPENPATFCKMPLIPCMVSKICAGVEDPDFVESLQWCITGDMIGGGDCSWLQREFLKNGVSDCSARKGPGDQVLIIFNSKPAWVENLESDFQSLRKWIRNIRIWCDELEKVERSVWLVIYGVPLNLWSFITFENIASLWGSLIKISEKN